jgi:hypothetical protein
MRIRWQPRWLVLVAIVVGFVIGIALRPFEIERVAVCVAASFAAFLAVQLIPLR